MFSKIPDHTSLLKLAETDRIYMAVFAILWRVYQEIQLTRQESSKANKCIFRKNSYQMTQSISVKIYESINLYEY